MRGEVWTRAAAPVAVVLPLALVPIPALGDCTPVAAPGSETKILRGGEEIGLLPGPGLPPTIIEAAIALWRRCPEHGRRFPSFVLGKGRTRTIRVEYHRRSASTACGLFLGGRIDLFAFGQAVDGRRLPCGRSVLVLAHELGHVLGLAHVPEDVTCGRHIMSEIRAFNHDRRRVQDVECRAADRLWLTPSEMELPIGDTPRASR